ncbi:3-dehydroquinate synthase II family protein [Halodesulfovibrio marinisediminis]|uniref:3-dehydroquinate synthase II n=1 Tax=Halodesulfovibrio marinisediminis DSM 17456 TaxID=1121457 RepID=A0A1N6GL02_9BACT|nr:3-dehydroquinate synthase II family protein [Halodesulfovibrio marinisediminis]SIO08190.1 3-dehydroquinate synthase II [Halodesulfovibrio marinisediminis DSM 17456]
MKKVLFASVPFNKDHVTLALESGVDGVIVPEKEMAGVASLSRCTVLAAESMHVITLTEKSDEEEAAERLKKGEQVIIGHGWEIIPIENLLAQSDNVLVEANTTEEAHLAFGILERGVEGVVVTANGITELKQIVAQCKLSMGTIDLVPATVTEVRSSGLGHRVCVDTLSVLKRGQGMLVGNSSAFTFLVHAETENNEYVAARPFRVNAGAVHAYTQLPHDKTTYLEELASGDEVLIVNHDGSTSIAVVGRCKTEIRPMLLIKAEVNGVEGAVFLQNAETIRVVDTKGNPISVVNLKKGDEILVRTDVAGRHFGMRIKEEIKEG